MMMQSKQRWTSWTKRESRKNELIEKNSSGFSAWGFIVDDKRFKQEVEIPMSF
jgi:hypothetical protein